jgi:hypothetical protein
VIKRTPQADWIIAACTLLPCFHGQNQGVVSMAAARAKLTFEIDPDLRSVIFTPNYAST